MVNDHLGMEMKPKICRGAGLLNTASGFRSKWTHLGYMKILVIKEKKSLDVSHRYLDFGFEFLIPSVVIITCLDSAFLSRRITPKRNHKFHFQAKYQNK